MSEDHVVTPAQITEITERLKAVSEGREKPTVSLMKQAHDALIYAMDLGRQSVRLMKDREKAEREAEEARELVKQIGQGFTLINTALARISPLDGSINEQG